jgi:GTP-binding protein
MIDGVCLIVDAAEGAMAQTKYVLSRALKLNLKPIVVLNKCDKDDAWSRIESGEVETELFDTFDSLGANDEQMDYVTVYSSGKAGWATTDLDVAREYAETGSCKKIGEETSMKVLLESILAHIPVPKVTVYGSDEEEPLSLAATTVGYDSFLGRLCTGRIYSGSIKKDDVVAVLPRDSLGTGSATPGTSSVVSGLFVNRGVERTELDPAVASAGDIVTVSGVPDSMKVGDTLTFKNNPVKEAIETPPINPPTLMMEIGANTSPLSGKEGTIFASSKVRARLISETDNNVTLSVTKSETDPERNVVHARGELQLGILIEQMRREGFELTVSPPQIITSVCEETGAKLEPFEEVTIDVDTDFSGTVVNALTGSRKGVLLNMSDSTDGKTRLEFEVPSRGLLGFNNEIATLTRGTSVYNHMFLDNREYAGIVGGVENGKLVSSDSGKAALFSLEKISKRGELFIEPGEVVYPGMVIGENSRPGDLEVNVSRSKETSNMRTVNKDEKLYIPPPKKMSVEELIGYMNDDELIEVTPRSVRLRKTELDSGVREREARKRKKQMMASKR